MFKQLGQFYFSLMQADKSASNAMPVSTIDDVDLTQTVIDPFTLGTYETPELAKRSRKELYTLYKVMGKDPTLSACLNLLTTAALGGHESRGQVVFINPADSLLGGGLNARDIRRKIELEKPYIEELINSIIYPLCRMATQYGDSYTRMYGEKDYGITNLLCNELTESPLIQPYEQGGRTIGFHVLEQNQFNVPKLTRLTTYQMARMKMQRVSPVPQFKNTYQLIGRILADNNLNNLPLIPSEVGGSFLQDAEEPWEKAILNMAALDSQQIADSVMQSFLTVNMANMPEAARKTYRASLKKMLEETKNNIRNALKGGDALFQRFYHILPVWDDKDVLTPMGDIAQRSSPLSIEYLMLHFRRMTGTLGIDISLTGWADMLAGGLGDGVSFHTSAQVMQRAMLIRQAATPTINHIINMHFGYKYGITFKPGRYPWKVEFYSDISAAAEQALNSKNTRASTLMAVSQAITLLKDLGLGPKENKILLTTILGLDDDEAERIASSLGKAIEIDRRAQNENYQPEQDPKDPDSQDFEDQLDLDEDE
ncbi:hypothetical protein [Acinetobacter colistiniresistens]|uniref:hypothetical protein n=1 Tax=Acinetobacter colistiniresistens TaxID=280145 RepID=UPI00125089FC|nr:hypothetical protein [Acinetobacter colistiniresistens]